MVDTLVRATGAEGCIRFVAVLTTEATKEATKRHSLSYLTSALMGRAMSAGLLLASSMKVNHGRVTLQFKSDGPLKGLVVDAGRDGTVRGYVGNPSLELDLVKNTYGNYCFDFRHATGSGYLHVIRDEGQGEPFTSTVELVGGGVGEDIASYLLHSEQTQSAVFVGEKIEHNQMVCSGGLIAQILPKAENNLSLIDLIENKCINIKGFSENLFKCRSDLSEIFKDLFPELQPKILNSSNPYQEVKFKCNCSRKRSISALKLLGTDELLKILEEDRQVELNCEFCRANYLIKENELKSIISQ